MIPVLSGFPPIIGGVAKKRKLTLTETYESVRDVESSIIGGKKGKGEGRLGFGSVYGRLGGILGGGRLGDGLGIRRTFRYAKPTGPTSRGTDVRR